MIYLLLSNVSGNKGAKECKDKKGKFNTVAPAPNGKQTKRSCKWVRKEPSERCSEDPNAKSHCPATCGDCVTPTSAPSEDFWLTCIDVEGKFKIHSVQGKKYRNMKKCSWALNKKKNTPNHIRCGIQEVREHCPATCDLCSSKPSQAPSSVPSFIPSSAPSPFTTKEDLQDEVGKYCSDPDNYDNSIYG